MVTENKRRSTTKKPKKVNNLRYAEYYDMQETFDGLYAKAAKGETFDSLMVLWSSTFVTLVAKKYHESVTLPSGLRMVYDNH